MKGLAVWSRLSAGASGLLLGSVGRRDSGVRGSPRGAPHGGALGASPTLQALM